MIIVTNKEQRLIPAIKEMIAEYVGDGGTPIRMGNGVVGYPLDNEGEMDLTQIQYEALKAAGIGFDKGRFFIQKPASFLDDTVPETFPESSTVDEEGNETQRIWRDYAPFHNELADGTYRIMCVHVPVGSTSGNGLPDEERLIWEKEFGSLMVLSEGMNLELVMENEV